MINNLKKIMMIAIAGCTMMNAWGTHTVQKKSFAELTNNQKQYILDNPKVLADAKASAEISVKTISSKVALDFDMTLIEADSNQTVTFFDNSGKYTEETRRQVRFKTKCSSLVKFEFVYDMSKNIACEYCILKGNTPVKSEGQEVIYSKEKNDWTVKMDWNREDTEYSVIVDLLIKGSDSKFNEVNDGTDIFEYKQYENELNALNNKEIKIKINAVAN